MNKLKKIFKLGSLSVASILYANNIDSANMSRGVVNFDLVNIRSTPSLLNNENILSQAKFGTILNIGNKEGNWYILHDGTYIDSSLVNPIEKEFKVIINCDFANIRNKPNFDKASRIRFSNKGEVLDSVLIIGDWVVLADGNLVHKSVVDIVSDSKSESVVQNKKITEQKVAPNLNKNEKNFDQKDKADILSTLEVLENVLANLIDEKEQLNEGNKEERIRIQHQINILKNNITQLEGAFNAQKSELDKAVDSYYLVTRNAYKRKTPTKNKDSYGFIYRGNIVKISEKTNSEYYKVDNYWVSTEHLTPLKQDTLIESFVKYSNLIVDDINMLKDSNEKLTSQIESAQNSILLLQKSDESQEQAIAILKNEFEKSNIENEKSFKNIQSIILESNKVSKTESEKQLAINLDFQSQFKIQDEKIVSIEKMITNYFEQFDVKNKILKIDKNLGKLETSHITLDERVTKGFKLQDTRMGNIEEFNKQLSSAITTGGSIEVSSENYSLLQDEISKLRSDYTDSLTTIQALQKEIDVLIKLSKKGKK